MAGTQWLRRYVSWTDVVVVGLMALLISSDFYNRYHQYKHFAVHEPGKVYRSAWVDAEVFGDVIRERHVRTVINLCEPGEMGDRILGQRQAVAEAGARLIELPFPSNKTWHIDHPAVREMEKILDDPESYPIWIHCQHGRERTVKRLAMYDIRERGLTAKESLKRMPLFGMQHPWPVVTFSHLYETEQKSRESVAARAGTERK